jgi:hypothetical protein
LWEMKFNLTKLNGLRQLSISALLFAASCGLNSCKLPAPERYTQADWSVQTSVTKEEFPIGVALEDVEDAPLPTPEEIAAGLPNHQGASGNPLAEIETDAQGRVVHLPLDNVPQDLPLGGGSVSEPPMPGVEPGFVENKARRAQDSLIANAPEPSLPSVSTVPPEPKQEIRPATVQRTPENLALMAAHSARPYISPRGNAVPEAKVPSPAVQTPVTAQVNPQQPSPDDLAEILQLAQKVESSRKR